MTRHRPDPKTRPAAPPAATARGRRGRRGKRVKTVSRGTATAHDYALRQWRAHCDKTGANPEHPDPIEVRDWIAASSHLAASTLEGRVGALKRHLRDHHSDIESDALWRPAETFIKALRRAQKNGTAPAPPPAPRPDPMLPAHAAALQDAVPARNADPVHVLRGQIALLALADGHRLADIARVRTSRTPSPPAGSAGLALALDPHHRNPATTLLLTRTPRAHALPSPADAAARLTALVPPDQPHLLAFNNTPDGPAPTTVKATYRKLIRQLDAAARRAGIPWNNPHDAADLTPDQLHLLHDALDPALLTRLRDHAERTLGIHTSLRADNLYRADLPDLTRNNKTGTDARWHLRLHTSKTRQNTDNRTIEIKPTGDPATCPVKALDELVALLRRLGRTQGPVLPGTDHTGRITGRRHTNANSNRRTKTAAAAAGINDTLTTRSYRIGAATHAAQTGHDLDHIAHLTGNDRESAGRYLRNIRPAVLRL